LICGKPTKRQLETHETLFIKSWNDNQEQVNPMKKFSPLRSFYSLTG
jgi:hypothetical protein